MARGDKYRLAWTFDLTIANDDVYVYQDGVPATNAVASVGAGTYITKGETASGAPTDFCDAFGTALDNAYTAMFGGGGGVITCTLVNGLVVVSNAGANGIVFDFANGASTMATELGGFENKANTVPASGSKTAEFVPQYTWFPDDVHEIDERYDAASLVVGVDDANGIRHYANHGTKHAGRFIEWGAVHGARVRELLADDATAAAAAGIVALDPHAPWTVLYEGVMSGDIASVYLYTSMDPSTHEECGPYYVVFDDADIAEGGVARSMLREDLRQRRYRRRIGLVSTT